MDKGQLDRNVEKRECAEPKLREDNASQEGKFGDPTSILEQNFGNNRQM